MSKSQIPSSWTDYDCQQALNQMMEIYEASPEFILSSKSSNQENQVTGVDVCHAGTIKPYTWDPLVKLFNTKIWFLR